jgi:tetratricopeptide (TPR) repeat protein
MTSAWMAGVLIALSGTSAWATESETYNPVEDLQVLVLQEDRSPASNGRGYASEFDEEVRRAATASKAGDHADATQRFFRLTNDPRFAAQRVQARYMFGLALIEMKLFQAAAFQFIEVIRSKDSKFSARAIEKLAYVADQLNNETLMNFAISRVKIAEFPATLKDMLYFRIGEAKLNAKDYREAIRGFENVRTSTAYYVRARYMMGLAYAQSKDPLRAAEVFEQLLQHLSNRPVNDPQVVAAMLGRARALYQGQKFEESLKVYRQVPKDSPQWHEALFESSWAMLQGTRFRSVLGNMESLHSDFYEDFFMPEALMLRAIVYLYICQFDEMTKTLDAFEALYNPVQQKLVNFVRLNVNSVNVYREVDKIASEYEMYLDDKKAKRELLLPFMVARRVIKDGEFRNHKEYINRLNAEERIVAQNSDWKSSSVGRYVQKIISLRKASAERAAGVVARKILIQSQNELRDQFEQLGFARYELLAAQKAGIEKKITGKDLPVNRLDEEKTRSFYTQNGYQYWPMKKREYWRDEVGNIYYLGVRSCE